MHFLTLSNRVDLGPAGIIDPGEYLVEDMSGAQLLAMAGGGRMDGVENERGLTELSQNCTAHRIAPEPHELHVGPAALAYAKPLRILLMRAGGFGDLILLTPVLREIKRRWPAAHVAVSTMAHYGQVLENLPFVDSILPYPLPRDVAESFDAWVFLEGAIEKNPRAKEIHMTLAFAEVAGISMDGADLLPAYGLRAEEGVWAATNFPRTGRRRACIQVAASGRCRTYPRPRMADVAMGLADRGWEVFLMGKPGDIPPQESKKYPTIRNLVYMGHTFRQSCAILAQSDCVVGPDSALIHVAGALNIRAVGLYGPFPWQLRTAHSPSILALSGTGDCAGCQWHENPVRSTYFPPHCPSAARGVCEVLERITPDRVIAKVDA